jgi:hypothetical protein
VEAFFALKQPGAKEGNSPVTVRFTLTGHSRDDPLTLPSHCLAASEGHRSSHNRGEACRERLIHVKGCSGPTRAAGTARGQVRHGLAEAKRNGRATVCRSTMLLADNLNGTGIALTSRVPNFLAGILPSF